MTNREVFQAEYTRQLMLAIERHPDQYAYPVERAPHVAEKMTASLAAGTANTDGYAIRNTCRSLGIAPSKGGIKDYLSR